MSTPSDLGAKTAPRALVLIKVDTLGDLVLFAPTLTSLRDTWRTSRIIVVIRQAYAELGPLLAADVEWLTTTLDPFVQGPAECRDEIDRLQKQISAVHPDVIAAATSRRNWLELLLAGTSECQRRIALGRDDVDKFFATQLRVQFHLDAAAAFNEHVAFRPDEPDWQRNLHLADHLLGKKVSRARPRVHLDDATRAKAAAWLQERRLEPGRYVVCAAAGFSNVRLKTWPGDHFATVLAHVRSRWGLPALLVGHETEGAHLAPIASATSAAVWLGADGGLPQLAALIAHAALFLGNDTGAMHLASALDVPTVAVFGGGTWPRFVPAARRGVSVVQPLPCFGCGWDCAFGDPTCIRGITANDVIPAVDSVLESVPADGAEIRRVEHLSEETREMMGKAAETYRGAIREHLARQHKLEELTELDREKDTAITEKESAIAEKEAAIAEKEAAIAEKEAEIGEKEAAIAEKENEINQKQTEIEALKRVCDEREQVLVKKEAAIAEKESEINQKQAEIETLKRVCDEREQLIAKLDHDLRAARIEATTIAADKALIEKTLAELPVDHANSVRTIAGQATHIRNLEALLQLRDRAMAELKASAENRAAGRHDLEQAKHYGKLLAEKEAVIRELHHHCQAREAIIRQLTAETTGFGGRLWKLWLAARTFGRERIRRPVDRWLFASLVEEYWMQIGVLRQYPPRPLQWDRLPRPKSSPTALPKIGIVTPSFRQAKFIERTMLSVVDQSYPNLLYAVQDGGSSDGSVEIIRRHGDRLHHWESVQDDGQADAIVRGFRHITPALAPDDLMAWLNSDDLFGPGVLRFVGEYIQAHPEVDVIYGHRIIIDDDDRDVGQWILPRHKPATLEWIDYIPQETLFWRKRAWELVGGIDPSFHFALDWDLIVRFQQAGCRIVRVPYFLGAFRVHAEQKTTQAIDSLGADEMRRIRTRFHGERQDDAEHIDRHVRDTRFRGAITARLHRMGIRR